MDSLSTKKSVLIALPAKNEGAVINKTITELKTFVQNQNLHEFDIVVFDDASTDKTRKEVESLGVKVYMITKSHGLGYVFSHIIKFFRSKNYDFLVTMDADGQFDHNEITKLLEPLTEDEADFVTGSRFMKSSKTTGISKIKKIGNKIGARYISKILGEKFTDVTCGFRAYTREAIMKLHTFSDFTYTQEVFLNLGVKKLSIVEIPITTVYFRERKSRMIKNVFSYIYKSLKIIIKFMILYAPMRLFRMLGNIFFIIAVLTGIFVFFWNMKIGTVTPYKWLGVTSVTSGILGVLMYSLGLLLQITSRIQMTLEELLYQIRRK